MSNAVTNTELPQELTESNCRSVDENGIHTANTGFKIKHQNSNIYDTF